MSSRAERASAFSLIDRESEELGLLARLQRGRAPQAGFALLPQAPLDWTAHVLKSLPGLAHLGRRCAARPALMDRESQRLSTARLLLLLPAAPGATPWP